MELAQLVKTALEKTRMLVLGAQILLGFELRASYGTGSRAYSCSRAISMALPCC
jgi:hypothetical protein